MQERGWSEYSLIERWLVVAARRRGAELGRPSSSPKSEWVADAMRACLRFLEAHGPEYADVRAWKARLSIN